MHTFSTYAQCCYYYSQISLALEHESKETTDIYVCVLEM